MKAAKYFVLTLLTLTFACKKDAGEGGNSLIQGKVVERKMSPSFSLCYGQYNAADKKVFIIYGDGTTPGNDVNTGPDGHFEFPYLRKGKYKIYTYGNDSAATIGPPVNATAPKMAVMKEVEITKNHQIIDEGTFVIYN